MVSWAGLQDALIARIEAVGPAGIHKTTAWPRVDAETTQQVDLAYSVLMVASTPTEEFGECETWVVDEWEITWRRECSNDDRVATFRQMLEDGRTLLAALQDDPWRRSVGLTEVELSSFEPPAEVEGSGLVEATLVVLTTHQLG